MDRLARHRFRTTFLAVVSAIGLPVMAMMSGCRGETATTEAVAQAESAEEALVHPEARWIWVDLDVDHVDPIAFYAVREFEIAAAPDKAVLKVVADEEYVLWLNGRRVGSGSYRMAAPIDAYDVTPWLQAGTNRIVAELRSARGQGGFLVALSSPTASSDILLVSDRRWRIVRQYETGLIEGWRPLPGSLEPPARRAARRGASRSPARPVEPGDPPFVWGPLGTGRWRLTESAGTLPLWSERFFQQPPISARRVRRAGPVRTSSLFALPTKGASRPRRAEASEQEGVGGLVGYLTLRFDNPRTARIRSALIHLGGEGRSLADGGATDALAIVVPGEELWRDSMPRRIDQIEVFGDAEALEAWVDPVDPVFPRGVAPPRSRSVEGVLGIQAPIVRSHIERRLRSRLYGMELPGTIVRSP